MYKNAGFREKFADLQEWIPLLVDAVKKDLKNEHLKKDLQFIKKYLSSKSPNKVTTSELAEAYKNAIQQEERGEDLAEFITSRWLLKNSELYEFFERHLSQINPDFTELEEIAAEQAQPLIELAVAEYGPVSVYLFSVLNSVVFPAESFHSLKNRALESKRAEREESLSQAERLNSEKVILDFEREKARLNDKHQKKIDGLQKKYITDTEALKKQIALLQRKLSELKS